MARREEIVGEVEDAVGHLGETIERLHGMGGTRGKSELARLRAELDQTIDAARAAEQRMAQWSEDAAAYDASEFESS